jgi:hypothetical protein
MQAPGRDPSPPDLRDDPAFSLNSYNWITLETWEFHPRRQEGYLGDTVYFNREHDAGLGDDEKDEDEGGDDTKDHEDAMYDNNSALAPHIVDPEI